MAEDPELQPHLVVPLGTQVVIQREIAGTDGEVLHPRNTVGVIETTPTHIHGGYHIRFADGTTTDLVRGEFAIRKHVQRSALQRVATNETYFDCVIYRCIVGSRAYGLDSEESDTDRRGIYLPPAELHWSLGGVPETIENNETEEAYWELQKFLELALKANPNVLECLYAPMVELVRPPAQELLMLRPAFLSQLIYQTYNGYVLSQFKKLEQDLRNRGTLKWKHVMHLIRLLLSGVTILREGFVPVRVDQHRERLLALRRGEVTWEEVDAWRLSLHAEFNKAILSTRLPELPDYARVNAFLIQARYSMVATRRTNET